MEEIAYMVCLRVDELDDPMEGSTTTACVECGDDIWISVESRKELGRVGAMPLCSTCAVRIAEEHPTEVRTLSAPSGGQFSEIMKALEGVGDTLPDSFEDLPDDVKAAMDAMPDDIDAFDALKETARMAGDHMTEPDSDWGSMAIMESYDGFTFPPIPLQQMLDSGVPKEIIATRLIPGLVHAANAKRVIFGISTWTLGGDKEMPVPEGPISEHPDRKEALVLIDITADGIEQMSMAEIIRDGVHKPRLGEWKDIEKPDATNGLFVDSLVPVLQLIRSLRES